MLLLVDGYEVSIKMSVDFADIISEFIESKLEDHLRMSNYNFKTISETMMKCFGLKVYFKADSTGRNYDSREVSIAELKDFLVRFRKESFMPSKFKLIMSLREFTENHLERLVVCTDNVS